MRNFISNNNFHHVSLTMDLIIQCYHLTFTNIILFLAYKDFNIKAGCKGGSLTSNLRECFY